MAQATRQDDANGLDYLKNLERAAGIEPATYSLGS
jgi:hypothetical protein